MVPKQRKRGRQGSGGNYRKRLGDAYTFAGKPHLKPVLGVLLNKRRKDVRLPYKHGIGNHVDSLAENNLNCGFYQDYLKNTFDIQRFEFESCGYKVTIPDGHHSLHLPFFQTNTSQYCTLYAVCRYGDGENKSCRKTAQDIVTKKYFYIRSI